MSVVQAIKKGLLSDGFDPFDLSQMQPPETFRTRDYSEHPPPLVDPFEGFRNGMKQLGNDLKRGLEIHVRKEQ